MLDAVTSDGVLEGALRDRLSARVVVVHPEHRERDPAGRRIRSTKCGHCVGDVSRASAVHLQRGSEPIKQRPVRGHRVRRRRAGPGSHSSLRGKEARPAELRPTRRDPGRDEQLGRGRLPRPAPFGHPLQDAHCGIVRERSEQTGAIGGLVQPARFEIERGAEEDRLRDPLLPPLEAGDERLRGLEAPMLERLGRGELRDARKRRRGLNVDRVKARVPERRERGAGLRVVRLAGAQQRLDGLLPMGQRSPAAEERVAELATTFAVLAPAGDRVEARRVGERLEPRTVAAQAICEERAPLRLSAVAPAMKERGALHPVGFAPLAVVEQRAEEPAPCDLARQTRPGKPRARPSRVGGPTEPEQGRPPGLGAARGQLQLARAAVGPRSPLERTVALEPERPRTRTPSPRRVSNRARSRSRSSRTREHEAERDQASSDRGEREHAEQSAAPGRSMRSGQGAERSTPKLGLPATSGTPDPAGLAPPSAPRDPSPPARRARSTPAKEFRGLAQGTALAQRLLMRGPPLDGACASGSPARTVLSSESRTLSHPRGVR